MQLHYRIIIMKFWICVSNPDCQTRMPRLAILVPEQHALASPTDTFVCTCPELNCHPFFLPPCFSPSFSLTRWMVSPSPHHSNQKPGVIFSFLLLHSQLSSSGWNLLISLSNPDLSLLSYFYYYFSALCCTSTNTHYSFLVFLKINLSFSATGL